MPLYYTALVIVFALPFLHGPSRSDQLPSLTSSDAPRAGAAPERNDVARMLTPWRKVARLLWDILVAPKLSYRIDTLTVYSDGVWAEFSITNLTSKRKYLDTRFVGHPVIKMSGSDTQNQRWQITPFKGSFSYGSPDEFIAIGPGRTVYYRQRLTVEQDDSLEIAGKPAKQVKERPSQLRYSVHCWTGAYTELSDAKQTRIGMYAIGHGQVKIEWMSEKHPKSLLTQQRLYGK